MRRLFQFACVSLVLSCSGGGSSGTDAGSTFTDSLRFGSGSLGFDLQGEATSFSKALTNSNIAFRFESAEDFNSRFVRLYIYSGSGQNSAPYWQNDFQPGQTYGHILVSSLRITDVGTYEVRAYLVTSGGSETHVVTSPIEITP